MSTTSPVVSISGLASGLDTTSIISALTSAENTAISTEQSKQTALQSKLTTWQTFNTNLLGLQASTVGLSTQASYASASATSSNTGVATVTASAGAASGTHNLSVTSLASNQQVLSGSQSDSSTPLGLSGSFELNGKSVNISASDTLASVATAINNAGAGVTAKILTISSGNVQLSLSSNATGTINAISAADLNGGNVLQGLGFTSSSSTLGIRQSITGTSGTTGAGSLAFASSATTVGTMLNGKSSTVTAPSGTVQINGTNVALDLSTMSLTDVANAINKAGVTGVTAKVVALPDANGTINSLSQQQLQLVSSTGAITSSSFTDSNSVLATLGIVQSSFTNSISSATDAQFSVDNVNYTRSTNSVNDVIPNVSMTLLSAGTKAAPVTSTISVSQDTSAAVSAVQNLVSSYNTVNSFINSQNTFTPPTSANGTATTSPDLFGDYSLITMQQQLGQTMSATVNGKSMADIGVTMGTDGTLSVDSSKLSTALSSDPTTVYKLFGVSGNTSNSLASFVSATTKTKDSGATAYPIVITQAASQGIITAGTAQTGASTAPETLTFNGKAFGSTPFSLSIPTGTNQAQLADLINSNSTLDQLLYATIDSSTNKLTISSKSYGVASSFNVVSDSAASSSNSGIGTTSLWGAGKDVAGTIDGEAATGLGQTLSAKSGNAHTDGLVLKITATAPGTYGAVTVSHGVADQLNSMINSFNTGTTSPITAAEDAINSQITDINTQITQMQTELSNYTTQLTTTFNNMESQLSALKSQSSALAAQLGTTSTTSTSSSSSSKSSSS